MFWVGHWLGFRVGHELVFRVGHGIRFRVGCRLKSQKDKCDNPYRFIFYKNHNVCIENNKRAV